MAAPDSPAPEYIPAVYVDRDKVDSEGGNPWHLAPQNPDLYAKIKAGTVVPMTKAAFEAKQKAQEEAK